MSRKALRVCRGPFGGRKKIENVSAATKREGRNRMKSKPLSQKIRLDSWLLPRLARLALIGGSSRAGAHEVLNLSAGPGMAVAISQRQIRSCPSSTRLTQEKR